MTSAATENTGTPEERRAAIYAGMTQILDEAIAQHPHIRYALGSETPRIRDANYHLCCAVNRFISGSSQLRKDVRPYFDRALAEYLKLADEIVRLMRATLVWATSQALKDYTELDTTVETPAINAANEAFSDARRRLLSGEGNVEETGRTFYEMIAAYLYAVTPHDLPVEPLDIAA